MAKSTLFRDKNRTGKGWWDRGRGEDIEKRRQAYDRIFGESDPVDVQKRAGKTIIKYNLGERKNDKV